MGKDLRETRVRRHYKTLGLRRSYEILEGGEFLPLDFLASTTENTGLIGIWVSKGGHSYSLWSYIFIWAAAAPSTIVEQEPAFEEVAVGGAEQESPPPSLRTEVVASPSQNRKKQKNMKI